MEGRVRTRRRRHVAEDRQTGERAIHWDNNLTSICMLRKQSRSRAGADTSVCAARQPWHEPALQRCMQPLGRTTSQHSWHMSKACRSSQDLRCDSCQVHNAAEPTHQPMQYLSSKEMLWKRFWYSFVINLSASHFLFDAVWNNEATRWGHAPALGLTNHHYYYYYYYSLHCSLHSLSRRGCNITTATLKNNCQQHFACNCSLGVDAAAIERSQTICHQRQTRISHSQVKNNLCLYHLFSVDITSLKKVDTCSHVLLRLVSQYLFIYSVFFLFHLSSPEGKCENADKTAFPLSLVAFQQRGGDLRHDPTANYRTTL